MKIAFECIPCIIRQAVEVAKEVTDDIDKQQQIIKKSLNEISKIDFSETAPVISRAIHNHAKAISNNRDPYKKLKQDHNIIAEDICKTFKLIDKIEASEDQLSTAIKLSIAGNIIDMGAYTVVERGFIESAVESCLNDTLDDKTLLLFKNKLSSAKKILFLADNAGEIVFDKLLINLLDKDKVTYVVKGDAIVNDATMIDAKESGMTNLVRVIDNGLDCQGTPLDLCSQSFKDEFHSSDLIISKGQANYETLSELNGKDIFYLLKAKCPSISEDLNCDLGKTVIHFTN